LDLAAFGLLLRLRRSSHALAGGGVSRRTLGTPSSVAILALKRGSLITVRSPNQKSRPEMSTDRVGKSVIEPGPNVVMICDCRISPCGLF
jgi:hypothetical protein